MLQLQYYNSNLKNNQINKILNNYQLKYTQMKNEIDSKLNQMLKIFLKDILTFLENIEEVAEHKRKINEFDTIKKELDLAKTKIKNKINIEHKLKNECDILQQENVLLKLKIKSLNNKISNLNNINLSNSFRTTSPIRITNSLNLRNNNSMTKRINYSNYMSPKNELDNNLYNSVKEESNSYINLISPRSELNKNENSFKYIDKLTLKLNYDKKIRIKNKFYKYKNNKKINIHKFVSTNKDNKVTKNISKEKKKNNSLKKYNNKKDNIKKKAEPIIKKIISSKKKKNNSSVGMRNVNSNNRYSPVNTNNSIEIPFNNYNNADYEDLGKKINSAFDNELKELQKDEENIELLLEQLNEDIINNNNDI